LLDTRFADISIIAVPDVTMASITLASNGSSSEKP